MDGLQSGRLKVTVIESIIRNLETLPASKLVDVAHFISGLNPNRRNQRIAALKETAGCMADEDMQYRSDSTHRFW
jgi:hypothetical protein